MNDHNTHLNSGKPSSAGLLASKSSSVTNLKENLNIGSARTKNRQSSGRINDRKTEVIGFPNDLHMIKT